MMITTKEIKIKTNRQISSEYVESELKKLGFDVLRWAITSIEGDFYILNIAVIE